MRTRELFLPCPLRQAVNTIHAALSETRLEIASEWDIAYDVRSAVGAIVPPSRAILVFEPVQLTKQILRSPGDALRASVPLELTEVNGQTHLRLHRPGLASRLVRALRSKGWQLPQFRRSAPKQSVIVPSVHAS
jgi:hypothetical protein